MYIECFSLSNFVGAEAVESLRTSKGHLRRALDIAQITEETLPVHFPANGAFMVIVTNSFQQLYRRGSDTRLQDEGWS